MSAAGNLWDGLPADLPAELCTTLLQSDSLRIERIVSRGHASPPGFWYDQDDHEWVLVVDGQAAVQFEGQAEPIRLGQGSYLHIPAHARHRVAWTDPQQTTVWLAIHYRR